MRVILMLSVLFLSWHQFFRRNLLVLQSACSPLEQHEWVFSRTHAYISLFFLVLTWRYTYWVERERDRNIDVKKIDQVPPIPALNRGSNLQTRYVPWLGTKPMTFWCMGPCSYQVSHSSRAIMCLHWIHQMISWLWPKNWTHFEPPICHVFF